MRVNHRRPDIAVPQQFLDGSNVVSIFDQVGREGVAKGVASDPLGQASFDNRLANSSLYQGLIHAMASLLPSLREPSWPHQFE